MALIEARPVGYDETQVWDEETQTWSNVDTELGSERTAQIGSRYKEQLVVVSDEGEIYYGEL